MPAPPPNQSRFLGSRTTVGEFCSYWLPPLVWGVAILVFSGELGSFQQTLAWLKWLVSPFVTLSPSQLEMIHKFLRKVGHLLAYGTLSFLWFRPLRGHLRWGLRRSLLGALLLSLTVASLDEGYQSLFPTRQGCLGDVVLDMGGAALGAFLTATLHRPGSPSLPIRTG
jgi:VanZ family protein